MASALASTRSNDQHCITTHPTVSRMEPVVINEAREYKAPAPITPDEATRILRQEEICCLPKEIAGVQRYDITRLPSNSPSEDDFAHAILVDPLGSGGNWLALGLFDGHVSWEMSAHLRENLLPSVWQALKMNANPTQGVDKTIQSAFLELDKTVIDDGAAALTADLSIGRMISRISAGSSGSCALVSLYDPTTCLLRVACVGDSRAVLGRPSSNADWEAIALSVDQQNSNPDEAARINREHPDEPDIIQGKPSRLMGIMVSRAFGDGFWKWDRELQERIAKTYFNAGYPKQIPFDLLKTPPYLTAEPVITTTEIRPESGEFVIMASDGFWDHMSNEQAVKLVNEWLQWKQDGMPKQNVEQSGARVKRIDEEVWLFHESVTTIQDENVATHLIRNALGGCDEDFLCGILSMEVPRSRNVRDDITVQVIFFGKSS